MRYEITLDDYLGAQRLHARWRTQDIKVRNIISALMMVAAIVLVLAKNYVLAVGMVGGVVGGFLVPFIWNNFVSQLVSRRTYGKLADAQVHQEIEISDNGIVSGSAKEIIRWSDFERWKENKDCILLYYDSKKFLIIPKRIDENGVSIVKLQEHLDESVENSA